jgi:hypothetical protein
VSEDEESSDSDLPTPRKEFQRNHIKYATQPSKSIDHLSSPHSPSQIPQTFKPPAVRTSVSSSPAIQPKCGVSNTDVQPGEVIEILDSDDEEVANVPTSKTPNSRGHVVLDTLEVSSDESTDCSPSRCKLSLSQGGSRLSPSWRENEEGVIEMVDSDDDVSAKLSQVVKSPEGTSENPAQTLSFNPAPSESQSPRPVDYPRDMGLNLINHADDQPPMEPVETNSVFSAIHASDLPRHKSPRSPSSAEPLVEGLSVPTLTGAVDTLTVEDGDVEMEVAPELPELGSPKRSPEPLQTSTAHGHIVDTTSVAVSKYSFERLRGSPQIGLLFLDEVSPGPLLEQPAPQTISSATIGKQSPHTSPRQTIPVCSASGISESDYMQHQNTNPNDLAPRIPEALSSPLIHQRTPTCASSSTGLSPRTVTHSLHTAGKEEVINNTSPCAITASSPPSDRQSQGRTNHNGMSSSDQHNDSPQKKIPTARDEPPVDYGLFGGEDGHWKVFFERYPEARKRALRSQKISNRSSATSSQSREHSQDEVGSHTTSTSVTLDRLPSPRDKANSVIEAELDVGDGNTPSPDELVYPDDFDDDPSDKTLPVTQAPVSPNLPGTITSQKIENSSPVCTFVNMCAYLCAEKDQRWRKQCLIHPCRSATLPIPQSHPQLFPWQTS